MNKKYKVTVYCRSRKIYTIIAMDKELADEKAYEQDFESEILDFEEVYDVTEIEEIFE